MHLLQIQSKIFELRGFKVMLDSDLAELYETETKRLKEAVRRNINRFPPDFMFELDKNELESLRTQIASSNRGGTRYMPFAFTEQGVAMLASVLNSAKAIEVNIQIVRAFVYLRQYALTHADLTTKLKELESRYNKQFKDVYEALNYLLNKDKHKIEQIQRNRIGYKTNPGIESAE
jgi:phage regulator Rha-like protein